MQKHCISNHNRTRASGKPVCLIYGSLGILYVSLVFGHPLRVGLLNDAADPVDVGVVGAQGVAQQLGAARKMCGKDTNY